MLRSTLLVITCFGTLAYGEGSSETLIPNDPLFSRQWGLHNSEYGHDIGALQAWQIEKGNKNIAVVVIGTGIDYTHPDLVNNMWVNPGEIPGNGVDDDNNGYIDDIHGINAITGTGDPMDDHGNDTLVAGIIGAEANNGIGIAGVMHRMSLIACKFLNASGMGNNKDAIKCLEYVEGLAKRTDIGVTIVATNNSWGGGDYSAELETAIKKQRDLGILFVATAGNDALNLDQYPMYPARYDVGNVIVVGKMESNGRHRDSGSYGPNSVHLSAPGSELLSIWLHGEYREVSGSYATAFVSGTLGLMKAHKPLLGWAQLKHRLLVGVKQLPVSEEQTMYISGGYCSALNSLQ